MNAIKLSGMLQFVGGKPMLILRDHEQGRIKVFKSGVWIATVGPGAVLGVDTEACLMGKEGDVEDVEERTTWGGVAWWLSEYQQHGTLTCMDEDGFPAQWDLDD
jgi:hypothetical protein